MNYILKSASSVDEAIELGLKELNISRDEADIEIIDEGSSGILGFIGKRDAVVRIGKKSDDVSSFVRDILYDKEEPEKVQEEIEEEVEQEPVIETVEVEETVEETEPVAEPEVIEEAEEIVEEPVVEAPVEESPRVYWDDEETIAKAEEIISRIIDEMDIDNDVKAEFADGQLYVNISSSNPDNLGIVIGNRGSTLDSIQYLTSIIINNYRDGYLRVIVDANNYREKRIKTLENLARRGVDNVLRSGRPYKMEPMNPADRRIVHMTLQDYELIDTHSEGVEPNRRVVITRKEEI